MSDKKKKKSSATLSGRYRVSGKKPSAKDIAAQIRADIRAGINLEGDNYFVEPYVSGSAYKGPKGKPRAGINRYGIQGEYRPTENTFIRARGSMSPKGENKQGGIEAGVTFKKGGKVKKCRMDGIALRGKTRAKERSK
tara:strand:- start:536 stop:949 length:414 start_codon:yes stop_codon:yes gene_type:complete